MLGGELLWGAAQLERQRQLYRDGQLRLCQYVQHLRFLRDEHLCSDEHVLQRHMHLH